MKDLDQYLSANTIIEIVKANLDIRKLNSEMTDDDIADVMRYLGSSAPDTIWAGDTPTLGRIGIGLMLSFTLYEFPEFYEEYELWQRN